ncbi:MAG: hypothetical protein AB7S38_01835 [Vulcanimicrobiota bacterium]
MTGKSKRLSTLIALVALLLVGFTLTPLHGQTASIDSETGQLCSLDLDPGPLAVTPPSATLTAAGAFSHEVLPEAPPRKSQTSNGRGRLGRAPPRLC